MKLFVHIPKNGGMSIRKTPAFRNQVILAFPQNHVDLEYSIKVRETMQRHGDADGFEHARLRDWNKELRSKHTAFAIVRNPWARVVSRYEFARKVILRDTGSNVYQNEDYADISSFEAFLEERHKWGGVEYMWHRAVRGWYPAMDHVIDEKGKVACDILRFEHMNEEVSTYFMTMSKVGHNNITGYDQSTYKNYYDDNTIQIVADWYQKDIDQWGFDFDTSATKNTLFKS